MLSIRLEAHSYCVSGYLHGVIWRMWPEIGVGQWSKKAYLSAFPESAPEIQFYEMLPYTIIIWGKSCRFHGQNHPHPYHMRFMSVSPKKGHKLGSKRSLLHI